MAENYQPSLFGEDSVAEAPDKSSSQPAEIWEQDTAKHALDELFTLTYQYKTSKSYHELMKFVARFRFYSPFNAMLVHVQMPGARFVAPPHRWFNDFGRRIRVDAKPLVILQPMGPVMFVFDVSDTNPTEDSRPLPKSVENPFEVRKGKIGNGLTLLIDNAKRDGLRITESQQGSQSAGSICRASNDSKGSQKFQRGVDKDRNPVYVDIPVRYDMVTNEKLSQEARYATIVHELAHLYCGHLGTPNDKWWPNRRGLNHDRCEVEAESVTYLVCSRQNIDNPSEQYLSEFVSRNDEMPSISLECVMKAAGLIETMSLERMKLRKP